MSDFAPVTLKAVDNNGKVLFQQSVPFTMGLSVRELLEQAFVLAQTSAKPDPFVYTLEYFGYSESAQFPGFLGYEIESIGGLANNGQFFWDLMLNGQSTLTGADTTYPNPGATVLWQYTPIPTTPQSATPRAQVVSARRGSRG